MAYRDRYNSAGRYISNYRERYNAGIVYDLEFTASGNGNLTPQITFSGTASVFVDGVEYPLTSTVHHAGIAVTTGQTIGYVFSDYDSITFFNISGDPVSGDISGWTLPASLVGFYVNLTSVSGDISGWNLPASLVNFWVYSTSVSYASASGAFTGITTALTKIDFDNCSLSAQHVTNALVDCDTANVTDTATIEIAGNNTAPLEAGLTAKSNLEGRGYAVAVTA